MKGKDLDDLVAACAKLAAKGQKTKSYVIAYMTRSGAIHTVRGGNVAAQVGIVKVVSENIMDSFGRRPGGGE